MLSGSSSLWLLALALLAAPRAPRAYTLAEKDTAAYALEYFTDENCATRAANDAQYWWWNDLVTDRRDCGRLLGATQRLNNTGVWSSTAWNGPFFLEEFQEVFPGSTAADRVVNVPEYMDGGTFFASPGPQISELPWELSISISPPVTLFLFEEDGPLAVLPTAELEADDWVTRDPGDFMRSAGMRLQLRPFKVFSKDFYGNNSEVAVTVSGNLIGGVSASFDCVQTTTSTTTLSSTTTSTSTLTTTPYWSYVMGPLNKYDRVWYLAGGGVDCDGLCAGLGGRNMNAEAAAEERWPDRCLAMVGNPFDVAVWFKDHGNKCNWTGETSSTTNYRTMGHGYSQGLYYQKCAAGELQNSGAWPNEKVTELNRCMVCACFEYNGRRLRDEDDLANDPEGFPLWGRDNLPNSLGPNGLADPDCLEDTPWPEDAARSPEATTAAPDAEGASTSGTSSSTSTSTSTSSTSTSPSTSAPEGGPPVPGAEGAREEVAGQRRLAEEEEPAPTPALPYLAGPLEMHGFMWYLTQPGLSCDAMCGEPAVNGQNLNINASGSWTDYCFSGRGRETDVGHDVASWWFMNDNPGDWTELWRYESGPTNYFTLGYGYPGGRYFHKCAVGSQVGTGALIGDTNNDPDRQNICACNLAPLYAFGTSNSELCKRGYREVYDEATAREAAVFLEHPPTSEFLQNRDDRPRGAYAWGNVSFYYMYFNTRTDLYTSSAIRGYPICKRQSFDDSGAALVGNGCFSGLTHRLGQAQDMQGSLNFVCSQDVFNTYYLDWRTFSLDMCLGPAGLQSTTLADAHDLLNAKCYKRGNLWARLNRKISDTHLRHFNCPIYHKPYGPTSTAHFRVTQGCHIGGGNAAPTQPPAYWWIGPAGCIAHQEWGPDGPISDTEFYTLLCDCPNTLLLKWSGDECTGSSRVVFWDDWSNFQTLLGLNQHCYGNGTLGTMLDKPLASVATHALPFWNCPLPSPTAGQPEACGVPTTTTLTTETSTTSEGEFNTTTTTSSTSTTCVHCYFMATTTTTTSSSTTPAPVIFPDLDVFGPTTTTTLFYNIGMTRRRSAATTRSGRTSWLAALLVLAATAVSR